MRYFLLLALLSSVASAAPLPAAPGLPPSSIIRPILDADPRVAAGRAGSAAAQEDMNLYINSPYEWNARATAQRRTIDRGPGYREWNVGLERTIRLPAKAKADRSIGKGTAEEGEAKYGETLRQTALELFDLWVDWTNAEQASELAARQLQIVQENHATVAKRVKAGDASKLDASLARAEVAEQQRMGVEASTASAVAWGKLHARFPAMSKQFSEVPAALRVEMPLSYWQQKIVDSSDELRVAQAQFAVAQAGSERARADRIPDPTIGVYTSSEVGGQERVTGVMLSIPIPGPNRSNRASKAVYSAEISRQELEIRKRELEGTIASQVASATGTFEAWKIADAGTVEMSNNAQLTQRAYSLGEADLQLLLTARRQAASAASTALAAKTAAARAYYTLLINAHLVWDMEHK